MVRPRITYRYSLLLKEMRYFCVGGGYLGMGETPHNAYFDWRWRVGKDKLKKGLTFP